MLEKVHVSGLGKQDASRIELTATAGGKRIFLMNSSYGAWPRADRDIPAIVAKVATKKMSKFDFVTLAKRAMRT